MEIRRKGVEAPGRDNQRRLGLLVHCGLLALVPMILLVPTQGTMLIVPVMPATQEASLVWATRAGARMLGPGPFPGSVLVDATAGQIWLAALSNGALLVRSEGADPASCTHSVRSHRRSSVGHRRKPGRGFDEGRRRHAGSVG